MSLISSRPTTYKGIKMRSRLEAGFAAWLDRRHPGRWEYEPQAFANASGQYLPDFRLTDLAIGVGSETRTAYVEVKPEGRPLIETTPVGTEQDPELGALLARMAIIWDSEPDARLLIAQPETGTIQSGAMSGYPAPPVVWFVAPVRLESQQEGWPRHIAFPFCWTHAAEWDRLAIIRHPSLFVGPWRDRYWEGPS